MTSASQLQGMGETIQTSPLVSDTGPGSVHDSPVTVGAPPAGMASSISCSLKRKRPPSIQIPDVLREIQTDAHLGNSTVSPAKDTGVCYGDLGVGVSSIKGKKKCMEDTHKIVSSLHGNGKKGFFGVYDGHGGRRAADYVAENLYANIMTVLENCSGSMSKDEAVKAGYLKTDEEFLKQGVGSGACCVTAFIEEKEMIISNLGDCRAVLCRGGMAEALTKDHRAGQDDERKRIEDMGGYVEFHRGAWRVHGTLSVSRSIGDAHLKDWVLAEPETRTLNLTSDMDFIILASDGLWDKVRNQEAVDILLRQHPAKRKLVGTDDSSKENVIEEYHPPSVSSGCSSPNIRRVSPFKHQQKVTSSSPTRFKKAIHSLKEEAIEDFDGDSESPPAKCRRISSSHQGNNTRIQSPGQENKTRPKYRNLVGACKELMNLAVTRGSLDDITVMIIDLSFFTDCIT